MADEIENEFMKRGYLLPKGCKDLIDVLKPKAKAEPTPVKPQRSAPAPLPPVTGNLPPVTGEITVPPSMTVRELAEKLSQKPFRIIADLMEIGVFATVSQCVGFDAISRVMRKYGFIAKRVPG